MARCALTIGCYGFVRLPTLSNGATWEEIRDRLRRAVTGWVNYYALADARTTG